MIKIFWVRLLAVLLGIGLFTNISFGQCNAIGSTPWNIAGTWNSCGGTFPTAANQVVITGFTVTLPSSQAAGNLAGSGTISSVGSNILSIGSALANTTFSGIIQNGAGITGITKVGSNTQTFSGANTYTGVTTINAGVVSVGTINNGGVAGNLGQAGVAATNLVLGGGTLQYTGGSASTDRAFALTTGTTSSINITTAGTTLTMSGASGNGTNGALTKLGSGTLLLSGANTYTGLTTISAGTIKVGSNTALGTNAAGTSVSVGAALDLNGVNYSTTEALTLNGTGTGATTGALLNSNATAATFAGTVALGSSSTINTTNQITLSGVVSGANT
ncbi:MAG: autotransporter-associated beta strand repeat-containing protein, partial [Opitutaceae bacterium]|nr:autotransporter-associated beta strand repeat-containing protein [Cytophagales bacterium]